MSTFTPLTKFFNIKSGNTTYGYLDHTLFSSITNFFSSINLNSSFETFNANCYCSPTTTGISYPLLFSFYPNSNYENKMFGQTPSTACVSNGGILNMYRPVPKFIDPNFAFYDFTARTTDNRNFLFDQTTCPLKLTNLVNIVAPLNTIPSGTNPILFASGTSGFHNNTWDAQFKASTQINLGVSDFLFKCTFVIFQLGTGSVAFLSNSKGFDISVNLDTKEVILTIKYVSYPYGSTVQNSPPPLVLRATGVEFGFIQTIEIYRTGADFTLMLFSGVPGLDDFQIRSVATGTLPSVDFVTFNFGDVYVGDQQNNTGFNWEIRHLTIIKNPYLNYLYVDDTGVHLLKNNYVSYDLQHLDNCCFAYNSRINTIYSCTDPTKVITIIPQIPQLFGTVHSVRLANSSYISGSEVPISNQTWTVTRPTDGDQFFPYITDGIWRSSPTSYYYFVSDTLSPVNSGDQSIMAGSATIYTTFMNIPSMFRKTGTCYFNGSTHRYTKIAYDTLEITDIGTITINFVTNSFSHSGELFKYDIGIKRFSDLAGTWRTSPYEDADILHFPYGSIGTTTCASFYKYSARISTMINLVRTSPTSFGGSYNGTTTNIDMGKLCITLGTKKFYRADSPYLNTPLDENMMNIKYINSTQELMFDDTFYIIRVGSSSTVVSCGSYTWDSTQNKIIFGYSEAGTTPIPSGTIYTVSADKKQISTFTYSGSISVLSTPVPVSGTQIDTSQLPQKTSLWVSTSPTSTTQFILSTNFASGFIDINTTTNPQAFHYNSLNFNVVTKVATDDGFSMTIQFLGASSGPLPGNVTLKFKINKNDMYNTKFYTVTLDSAINSTPSIPVSSPEFRFIENTSFPLSIQNCYFSNSDYKIILYDDLRYVFNSRTSSSSGKYRYISSTKSLYFTDNGMVPHVATYHAGAIYYNTKTLLVNNNPW